jgi:hypothetical protein
MMRKGYGLTSWAWRWAPVYPAVFLGCEVRGDVTVSVWAVGADALVGP